MYYSHGLSRSDFSARNSQSDVIDRACLHSDDRDHLFRRIATTCSD
jgi:hypothetical protein